MSAAKRPSKPVAKSTKESTKAKPRLIPRPNGAGALNSGGTPGNKGGTGRPPDEFKARMRELATRAEVERELEKVLKDRTDSNWLGALKHATEHGYGKANQPVDLGLSESLTALLAKAFTPE